MKESKVCNLHGLRHVHVLPMLDWADYGNLVCKQEKNFYEPLSLGNADLVLGAAQVCLYYQPSLLNG